MGLNRCVYAVRVVEVPVFICLRSSCNHVSEIGDRTFRDTRIETCYAKWRGLCGYNRGQTSKYCLIVAGRSLSSIRIIAPRTVALVWIRKTN